MDISGQFVGFFLTREGRLALKGLVPAGGSFEALVLGTDALGPLVWSEFRKSKRVPKRLRVMLLRWDYIASMVFEYRYPVRTEAGRPGIGFRST
jgi:hypothetical protein